MEQSFKPDKKLFTKVLLIQSTISVFLVIVMSITHLIIKLVGGVLETTYMIGLIGIICLLAMWILSSFIAHLWIKNLEYVLHDDRVIINKGILTKTQKNIPLRAITDFDLVRTLYDRVLGIGSIKIQTAGQSTQPSGYEGKLGGIKEYKKWHSLLREKVKSLHPISESATTVEAAPKSDIHILKQILNELEKIRKNTSKI